MFGPLPAIKTENRDIQRIYSPGTGCLGLPRRQERLQEDQFMFECTSTGAQACNSSLVFSIQPGHLESCRGTYPPSPLPFHPSPPLPFPPPTLLELSVETVHPIHMYVHCTVVSRMIYLLRVECCSWFDSNISDSNPKR